MDGGLLASRIVALFLFLVGTFGFGVLPWPLQKTLMNCDCDCPCKPNCRARKGRLVTSFLIYLGGGVLLATCFIHLLPESRHGFEDHDHKDPQSEVKPGNDTIKDKDGGHDEEFPIPEFIVCLGFFGVYLFEQIISHFYGGHSHVPTETRAIRSMSRSNSCRSCGDSVSRSNSVDVTNCQVKGNIPVVTVPEETKVSISGLLTVAALSFHSLFEGFAVGLQDTVLSTWILFLAVSVHKFVIAFVVGVEVLAGGASRKQLLHYMIVFSLMTPIGMSIAMITASNVEDTNPVVVSVLNAIATGTLLYVTFFEILQSDEHKDVIPSKVQLLATFTGFVVMCLVQFASTYA